MKEKKLGLLGAPVPEGHYEELERLGKLQVLEWTGDMKPQVVRFGNDLGSEDIVRMLGLLEGTRIMLDSDDENAPLFMSGGGYVYRLEVQKDPNLTLICAFHPLSRETAKKIMRGAR